MISQAANRPKIFLVAGLLVSLLLPGFALARRSEGSRNLEE